VGVFSLKLVNIGFGNAVNADRVIAMVSPDSAPIKRIVQDCKERGTLIDASHGRKTKTVILMDSDHAVLSYLQPENLIHRMNEDEEEAAEL
jgi:extracellular matrix regulatory protein A